MISGIIGVGIDICGWDRIPEFDRDHPFFRIFSGDEIDYCISRPNPAPYFASRFAAREALLKAMGEYSPWMGDVEIGCTGRGSPFIEGPVPDDYRIFLSLSHDVGTSVALVVVTASER